VRQAEAADAQTVHLDLGGVRLPTAEGLGVLVTLAAELRNRGGGLVLVNVPAETYGVLAVTHLVDVLHVGPAFPCPSRE
jgi:anti-anti-sigma factor